MKTTLIAISLLANLLVGVVLFSPASVERLDLGRFFSGDDSRPARTGRTSGKPGEQPGTPRQPITWSEIEKTEPRELAAALNAAGIPRELVYSIVQYRIYDAVTRRRREMQAQLPPQKWYQSTSLGLSSIYSNPSMAAELRQLQRDANGLLLDTMGPPPDPNGYQTRMEQIQFGSLPPEKVVALKQIIQDYQDMQSATTVLAGASLPEDYEKRRFLEQERDKDLRALLTADEYENYQLRSSNTANNLRNNLALFQPTEEEFRKIFALQEPFDRAYSQIGPMTTEASRQRQAANAELTAQIKASLDPARLAEYEKATDGTFRSAHQLVTRLQLPTENATALWQMQKDIQQRATTVRTNQALSQEARIAELAALQQEATMRAGAALGGERGLEAYKAAGGNWMTNLVPIARPAIPGSVAPSTTTVIQTINGGTVIIRP